MLEPLFGAGWLWLCCRSWAWIPIFTDSVGLVLQPGAPPRTCLSQTHAFSGAQVQRWPARAGSAGVPAFLGAERPLMDSGRGVGPTACSSLRAHLRVLVGAVPSPTRSGRESMWESHGYMRVKSQAGGCPGIRTGSRVGPPFPSSPFSPSVAPVGAHVPWSAEISLTWYSPHLGASWGSRSAGWAPWGGVSEEDPRPLLRAPPGDSRCPGACLR